MEYGNPVDWFTTEDGVHVPLYAGESKKDAMNRQFGKNYDKPKMSINRQSKKYINSRDELHKMLYAYNSGEKTNYEKINWFDTASGTHDINITKDVFDRYYHND